MKRIISKFRHLSKRKKGIIVALSTTIILVLGLFFFYVISGTKAGIVARVNKEAITRERLQQTVEYRTRFFEASNQILDTASIENDSLTIIIDEILLAQYAQKNNVTIEDSEVQTLYAARIKQIGSEDKLLIEIARLYGFDKDTYLNFLKNDLLSEKVQEISGVAYADWLQQQKTNSNVEVYL